jgi:hypothetical protein
MLWVETRQTTREEDMAFGIFDLHMPLIYGEGRESVRARLREAIDKKQKGMWFLSS